MDYLIFEEYSRQDGSESPKKSMWVVTVQIRIMIQNIKKLFGYFWNKSWDTNCLAVDLNHLGIGKIFEGLKSNEYN